MEILAQRIGEGPIINPNMDARMGGNVNGPSLIKVPEWLPNLLGRYYLYIGHHDGGYIRLAFANELTGPWRTHEAGVLPLSDSLFAGHIASPDAVVDNEKRQIRLYFHGADAPTGIDAPQYTRVALSGDGLDFEARPEILGRPYMRVVQYKHWHYAIAMPGTLYRSQDGLNNFEEGANPFEANMRHAALFVLGDRLLVFYTKIGDIPERILVCQIDLADEWRDWRPSQSMTVIEPECDYEGAALALRLSVRGLAKEPVRELRDPAIFEEDGKVYLLYSVAGESGIAIAKLQLD
jgi:hypothetical protein